LQLAFPLFLRLFKILSLLYFLPTSIDFSISTLRLSFLLLTLEVTLEATLELTLEAILEVTLEITFEVILEFFSLFSISFYSKISQLKGGTTQTFTKAHFFLGQNFAQ